MIRVRIGGTFDYYLEDAREQEIIAQIQGRRNDGSLVCVEVLIEKSNLRLTLVSRDCGFAASNRTLDRREREIVELWQKMHMSTGDFTGGNLVGFLKQLKALV